MHVEPEVAITGNDLN